MSTVKPGKVRLSAASASGSAQKESSAAASASKRLGASMPWSLNLVVSSTVQHRKLQGVAASLLSSRVQASKVSIGHASSGTDKGAVRPQQVVADNRKEALEECFEEEDTHPAVAAAKKVKALLGEDADSKEDEEVDKPSDCFSVGLQFL
ncbi:hypothetical protein BDK51DRAFT_42646 [Blyttiomyces helicus]|uniref:Uncharacterized protein n=1 Tax=Blyttiomyces helicus TaxID=388810 RepID=A0A4P9W679_9FUNG|nr:hypothetical protein BDK51DRAFT_42646 [Blyttiomyces helicus]|eukprot:RKO87482.1 hypothetical protein BDK51DRAFT_42646 [Blyttiomyces helicus]